MQINGYQLLPYVPEWGRSVGWSRKWQTDVASMLPGKEVRTRVAKDPLLGLVFSIVATDLKTSTRAEADIRAALLSGLAAVPYWGKGVTISGGASGVSVPFLPTPYSPANGDWLFFGDSDAFDVVQVQSAAGGVITLQSALSRSYPANSLFWPILFGKIDCKAGGAVNPDATSFDLEFVELVPNTLSGVGAINGSSTAGIPTLNGLLVFTVENFWNSDRVRNISYDLKELQVGFGAPKYVPTDAFVARVLEVDMHAGDQATIATIDNFLVNVNGRAQSFYFPDPSLACKIVAAVDNTHFKVAAQGTEILPSGWRYCLFVNKVTLQQRFAEITASVDNGDGTETITCVPVTTGGFDPDWYVYRLHICRLADDIERATFVAEGMQSRTVRFTVPPNVVSVSAAPIWLFRFISTSVPAVYWYYTSFHSPIVFGGNTYVPAAISQTALSRSIDAKADNFGIKKVLEDYDPFWCFLPRVPSYRVTVEIYETDESGTAPVLRYTGEVTEPHFSGKAVNAKVGSVLSQLDRKVPAHNYQPRCNYNLGDGPCGINLASLGVLGGVISVSGPSDIVFSVGAFTTSFVDYFTGGFIVAGTGLSYEIRTIAKSSYSGGGLWNLTLSYPFQFVAVPGGQATAYPGCDGRLVTCNNKFANKPNFGGWPWIPINNLTIKARSGAATGGKK